MTTIRSKSLSSLLEGKARRQGIIKAAQTALAAIKEDLGSAVLDNDLATQETIRGKQSKHLQSIQDEQFAIAVLNKQIIEAQALELERENDEKRLGGLPFEHHWRLGFEVHLHAREQHSESRGRRSSYEPGRVGSLDGHI